MEKFTDILFCHCKGGQELDSQENAFLYDHVLKLSGGAESSHGKQLKIHVVSDLCHWAAKEKESLTQNLVLGKNILIIGSCSARAVIGLLNFAGIPVTEQQVGDFVNYRNISSSAIISRVKSLIAESGGAELNHLIFDYTPSSLAWFPVIDKELCTNCRQCENFCLFGVYKYENENVVVNKPLKCKPYCPACSKICPQSAVIFPKHDSMVTNGGELRTEEPTDKTIARMTGPELMSYLQNRTGVKDKAKELGIPDSVIESMSPDQISRIVKDRS